MGIRKVTKEDTYRAMSLKRLLRLNLITKEQVPEKYRDMLGEVEELWQWTLER